MWRDRISTPEINSISELMENISSVIGQAKSQLVIKHLAWLYQGNIAGEDVTTCTSGYGVVDMTGNVEEWARRRDGGAPQFHGKLKGRYWAETRTCFMGVQTHGDLFRFYEIGFRCCQDCA